MLVSVAGNDDISLTKVRGYWRPLESATPFNGEKNEIDEGTECKVEIRCKREYVKDALGVIKKIHPYEEPLVNIIPLANCYFVDSVI